MSRLQEQIALSSMEGHLGTIYDRRKTEGELVLPNVFAALELLPFEVQETIGTLLRTRIVECLLEQNAAEAIQCDPIRQSVWVKIKELLCKTVGIPLPPPPEKKPIPSFADEMQWLAANVNRQSPTQCFLMSDILATHPETMELAKQWYVKGMQVTRELSDEYKHLVLSIFE